MAVLEPTPSHLSSGRTAVVNGPDSRAPTSPAGPSAIEICHRLLLDGELDDADTNETIERIAGIVLRHTNAVGLVYCDQHDAENWRVAYQTLPGDAAELVMLDESDWTAWCEAASRTGRTQPSLIGGPTQCVVIAMPVKLRGGRAEAFCAVFFSDRLPTEQCIETLQLASTQFTVWRLWNGGDRSGRRPDELPDVERWLEKIAAAPSFEAAAVTVVNHAPARLGCDRAALGTTNRAGACRTVALSGVAKFDRRTAYVRAIEAAFAETIANGGLTTYPESDDSANLQTAAHRKLAEVAGAKFVVSTPIRDQDFAVIGVWLLLGSDDAALPQVHERLYSFLPPIETALDCLRVAEQTSLVQRARKIAALLRNKPAAWAAVAIVVLLAAMCFPISYKLKCDCVVEPLTKRFVTAPFDGTLKQSLVRPGAAVKTGDLLARMDDREIRLELAGLEADLSRARKRKDAALAGRKTSDAQLAALEVDRLQAKLQMLHDRLKRAEIRSPLDGIVVGGDPQQVEGGPLEVGRTLFEVAPPDGMIVEAAVPENEIIHVRAGMEVHILLDSMQNAPLTGVVHRIHPSSEIREHENVFVVEVALSKESESLLKPGMNGQARIVCDRRSIGWILFHRAAAAVGDATGW